MLSRRRSARPAVRDQLHLSPAALEVAADAHDVADTADSVCGVGRVVRDAPADGLHGRGPGAPVGVKRRPATDVVCGCGTRPARAEQPVIAIRPRSLGDDARTIGQTVGAAVAVDLRGVAAHGPPGGVRTGEH